jgi:KDO2-lipid IV(A) lauroyltransferase
LSKHRNPIRDRAEYAIAFGLMRLLRGLAPHPAMRAARAASRLLDLSVPRLRRVARTNLKFAFPDWSARERERTIDGVFENIARLLAAFARFPDLTRENTVELIEYDGLENYMRAKEKGRGVLVATAHLGNWELSAFAHALLTEPMHVMVRPLDNPLIDKLVEERRTLSGNRLISKREAARPVLKALRAGEAVGVLIDQNTSAEEGVFVQFFGRPACANPGVVKLSYHSGAPIVPGFALWDKWRGKYVLRFLPEVPLTGDAARDTQKLHSLFEEIIRKHPDQWMWIHRRWKTQPPDQRNSD